MVRGYEGPSHSSPHFQATGLLGTLKAGDSHQFQLRLTDHLPLLPSPDQSRLDKETLLCLYGKMVTGVSSSCLGSTLTPSVVLHIRSLSLNDAFSTLPYRH